MITINWGSDDKRIMQYEFEGSWDIEDLIEALDAGIDVASRYDHEIDVVVDLAKSGFPNLLGMNVNKAFKRAVDRSEEHQQNTESEPGMVVIVTRNPVIRNSLGSLLKLYPAMGNSTLSVANSIEDAHAQIATFREREAVA